LLARLVSQQAGKQQFDFAIIGGGATGLGVALDAAARGFRVVLLDSHDFAKGTSSRSTKLLHGGVRYLAQGNIALVTEALHERTTLLKNAPHLAQALPFIMPSYRWWETPYYGAGLKLYDALAGKSGLGKTTLLSREKTLAIASGINPLNLRGSVQYWDAQFDDARLAVSLARTAAQKSALLVNYCRATRLLYDKEKICGLECQDTESGAVFQVQAQCVINATGVWVDDIRQMDAGIATTEKVKPMVAPSQGVHLVVDRQFLNSRAAMMVPKTQDGRVLFAVPWLGHLVLGTTDTPRADIVREPQAFDAEVDFILTESARYLKRAPTRSDVKSIWVGLRPLVKPVDNDGKNTKGLSREHTIVISKSGLVTVTGGKWTTYRAMAEDVLEQVFENDLAKRSPAGLTEHLVLQGGEPVVGGATHSISDAPGIHSYGSEQGEVQSLPGAQLELAPGLTEAMVRFAARFEYARTVEDVLARRSRLLFLDARLAVSVANRVAALLVEELAIDPQLEAFLTMAQRYHF
jgi:glycerol-3-phosphate dehydrogenase